MVSMDKLTNARRAEVVRCLVEGNSIRATVRMTGVAKNTIAKLLLGLGEVRVPVQITVTRWAQVTRTVSAPVRIVRR